MKYLDIFLLCIFKQQQGLVNTPAFHGHIFASIWKCSSSCISTRRSIVIEDLAGSSFVNASRSKISTLDFFSLQRELYTTTCIAICSRSFAAYEISLPRKLSTSIPTKFFIFSCCTLYSSSLILFFFVQL